MRSARTNTISNLPPQSIRPFDADYPNGALADVAGRLLADIEGRPLVAPRIIGRRMVQGADESLPRTETIPLATAVTGNDVTPLVGGTDLGRFFYQDVVQHTLRPGGEISVRAGLPPAKADQIVRHELGHAIDEIVGQVPTAGLSRELRTIYDAGLTGRLRARGLTGPEHVGYSPSDAPRELWAEAVRAYLNDPNALKSVAPSVAARIRQYVNAHPDLSKLLQFNAIPVAVAGGIGGTIGLREALRERMS